MELSEFLLARIAEDEAVAEAAAEMAQHHVGEPPVYDWQVVERDYGGIEVWPAGSGDVGNGDSAETEHIARHDPARVLAECEAKRRIVGYAAPSDDFEQGLLRAFADPAIDATVLAQAEPFARLLGAEINRAMDDVLRLLALPYADHPDYRQEWRP